MHDPQSGTKIPRMPRTGRKGVDLGTAVIGGLAPTVLRGIMPNMLTSNFLNNQAYFHYIQKRGFKNMAGTTKIDTKGNRVKVSPQENLEEHYDKHKEGMPDIESPQEYLQEMRIMHEDKSRDVERLNHPQGGSWIYNKKKSRLLSMNRWFDYRTMFSVPQDYWERLKKAFGKNK